jgi:hypothetical protein
MTVTRHAPRSCRWLIVGSSATGKGHERRGLPCQDAFRVWHGPAGVDVIAVADGAGTASHAHLGATQAAELAIAALWAHFLRGRATRPNIAEALTHAFATVRGELATYAERKRIPLASLATTLTVAVLMPDCLAVAQTGDGLVAARNDRGDLKAATRPQGGEYANETCFITGAGGEVPGFVAVYTPVSALAVLTDGLLPIAADYKEQQPYRGFFDPMFAALHQATDPDTLTAHLAGFLASDRVNAHTDDDKTLVLAVRRGSGQR